MHTNSLHYDLAVKQKKVPLEFNAKQVLHVKDKK